MNMMNNIDGLYLIAALHPSTEQRLQDVVSIIVRFLSFNL